MRYLEVLNALECGGQNSAKIVCLVRADEQDEDYTVEVYPFTNEGIKTSDGKQLEDGNPEVVALKVNPKESEVRIILDLSYEDLINFQYISYLDVADLLTNNPSIKTAQEKIDLIAEYVAKTLSKKTLKTRPLFNDILTKSVTIFVEHLLASSFMEKVKKYEKKN